mgnify:CR=1 FL=1
MMTGGRAVNLFDESGVPYGVKHIANKPRVSSMPYTYDIAEENVPNHRTWSKNNMNVHRCLECGALRPAKR